MKIFIYSRQQEISQIISDHLSDKGHLCFAFKTLSDFSLSLRSLNKLPDLIILDYLSFNHDIFNIYDYMDKTNISVPLIYYNDPCLLRSSRFLHWMAMLEITRKKYIKSDLAVFEPVFQELEKLIEAKEFKPYISLLQEHKPVPVNLIKDKYTLQYLRENQNDCIYTFKERTKIPNNLFYLLLTMQENKELELSLEDIAAIYRRKGRHITTQSLRVLMSKLRKQIRNDKECNFLIYHDKDRYRFVRFKI